MSRKPGPERNPDLRREIRRIAEKCGCPVDRCREYLRNPGLYLARLGLSLGFRRVRRTFPEPEVKHGPA